MAKEFTKNIKTSDDLNCSSKSLKKLIVEVAFHAEFTDLGYQKNSLKADKNVRNDYISKRLITSHGKSKLHTSKNYDNTFDAQCLKKYQTDIPVSVCHRYDQHRHWMNLIANGRIDTHNSVNRGRQTGRILMSLWFILRIYVRQYTTNTIELLNNVIWRVIRSRKIFPTMNR